MMKEALKVIEAWGFTYKSIAFQWVKQNRSGNGYFFGLGRWTRGNTEPCLLAVKGKPKRISASVGQLVFSPLRRHSQKPDEVRDKYVEQLAQNVTDGRIDLHELTGMETEQARTYLKSIHGVGNKVADCVLLFGLHRVEAFPVDTWIRQVIDEHYGGKFPVEHYNGHAGIIQQFIFYYMQQHKGGKTT